MISISSVIIAPPTLPFRFISSDYDKFLFFDIDLGTDGKFLDELQKLAGNSAEISVYYSQTLTLLGEARIGEKWSGKVRFIVEELATQGEYLGLIIADRKGSWVLAQETPISLGVFGIKHSNMDALRLFHANETSRDWFVSIEHFKQAIADSSSSMRESFDVEFMKTLVSNHS